MPIPIGYPFDTLRLPGTDRGRKRWIINDRETVPVLVGGLKECIRSPERSCSMHTSPTAKDSWIPIIHFRYTEPVMPLYIRDDAVKELASEVATLQRSTVTDAVRDALTLRLQQLQDEQDERSRKIDEFLAKLDAEPDLAPGFTDKDLYDENGDPVW